MSPGAAGVLPDDVQECQPDLGALRLAQARYDAGLGSIVELNQAELSQTSALIAAAGARFNYLSTRAGLNYTLGILR